MPEVFTPFELPPPRISEPERRANRRNSKLYRLYPIEKTERKWNICIGMFKIKCLQYFLFMDGDFSFTPMN